MTNSVYSYKINNNSQTFGQQKKDLSLPQNAADEFISGINESSKKYKEGDFLSKYCWSNTAALISGIPVVGYVFGNLFRLNHLKKKNNIAAKESLLKSFNKGIKFVIPAGIALFAGLQYLFKSQSDKNYKEIEKEFNSVNTTNAKLSGTIVSSYIGAGYHVSNGNIFINRNIMNDPLTKNKIKKLIRHELVHAKQFEMIARSKDGIKKLNYGVLIPIIRSCENDKNTIKGFQEIYEAIQQDKSGKYNNLNIETNGSTFNFKNYIEAINILLTNKNATYNDIPIAIDENHYKEVIKEKGALSREEEIKAEEYFKALSEYKPVSFLKSINPFGSYYSNILEKEAYKENPTFWMKLFGKDK